jgi:hypothetical protein
MSNEVDLQALGITEDEEYTTPEASQLPSQMDMYFPPPQPGRGYSFFVPGPLVWLPEIVNERGDGKMVTRQRCYFRSVKDKPATAAASPLEIVGSPKDEYNGQTFPYSITTTRRARNKEKTVWVSDATYLALAIDPAFQTQLGLGHLVQFLQSHLVGAIFDATVDWGGNCNPLQDIYHAKEEKVIEGRKGCGMKYALRRRENKAPKAAFSHIEAIPKDGTKWLDRFVCFNPKCGALVRMFPNLMAFKHNDELAVAEE